LYTTRQASVLFPYTTLFRSQIETATQAAEALRPVGGEFAFLLFATGIIGTGLLAVPVLAGSVGYALAEIASWPRGLAKKPENARDRKSTRLNSCHLVISYAV